VKAQTWSTDIIIAVVLFVLIILGFFYVTNLKSHSEKLRAMTSEAEKIHESLTTASNKSSLAFIEGSKVNPQKLAELADISYEELKAQLGIEGGDFCIHFEDENGEILFIRGNRVGIGSGKVDISGIPCNETR
jgi:hypothetical protein